MYVLFSCLFITIIMLLLFVHKHAYIGSGRMYLDKNNKCTYVYVRYTEKNNNIKKHMLFRSCSPGITRAFVVSKNDRWIFNPFLYFFLLLFYYYYFETLEHTQVHIRTRNGCFQENSYGISGLGEKRRWSIWEQV